MQCPECGKETSYAKEVKTKNFAGEDIAFYLCPNCQGLKSQGKTETEDKPIAQSRGVRNVDAAHHRMISRSARFGRIGRSRRGARW